MQISKRSIIIAEVIAGLLVVLWLLPMMISWQGTADSLLAQMERETNSSISLLGEVDATLLPRPVFTLYDVTVEAATPRGPIDISIPELSATCAILSLFIFDCDVAEVSFIRPAITLHPPLDANARRALVLQQENAAKAVLSIPLRIVNGSLTMQHNTGEPPFVLKGINLHYEMDDAAGPYQLEGSVKRHNDRLAFNALLDGVPSETSAPPLKVTLKDSKTTLHFDGNMNRKNDRLAIDGAVTIESSALQHSLSGITGQDVTRAVRPDREDPAETGMTEPDAVADLPPLPLTVQGNLAYNGEVWTLKKLGLQSGNSSMQLSFSTQITDPLQFALIAKGEQVVAEEFYPIVTVIFNTIRQLRYSEEERRLAIKSDYFTPIFPDNSRAALKLDIKTLMLKNEVINDLQFTAKLQDKVWRVAPSTAQLPFDTTLSLDGNINEVRGGFRFAGDLQSSGPSLSTLLGWMGLPVEHMPDGTLQAFSLQSGFAVQPGELRITDGSLSVDDTELKTTIVLKAKSEEDSSVPLLDVTLSTKELDLDRYLPPQSIYPSLENSATVVGQHSIRPVWLEELPVALKITGSARALTFRSIPLEIVRTRINAKPGEFMIDSFTAVHEKNPISARVLLKTGQFRPLANVIFLAQEIDTRLFTRFIHGGTPPKTRNGDTQNGSTQAPDGATDMLWSNSPLDLYPLDLADGKFAIDIKKLTHKDMTFSNISSKGTIENRQMHITDMTGETMDGRFKLSGEVTGGSVPGIELEFSTYAFDLQEVMQLKSEVESINGLLDINGIIRSQGVTPLSLIENMQANLQFTIQKPTAARFDLNALSRRVTTIRKIEDVHNLSKVALAGGTTKLDSMQGVMTIRDGQLQIPVARLYASYTEGQLTGAVDLTNLMMNTQVSFRPLSRATEEIPMIHLKLSGDLNDPKKQLDTRDLEDFVAKRAVKKRF